MFRVDEINWKEEINEIMDNKQDMSYLLTECLYEIPDEECLKMIKSTEPKSGYHGCLVDFKIAVLALEALKKVFDNLQEIRKEGLITHRSGHAIAYRFKKCLRIFEDQFLQHSHIFRDVLGSRIERLSKAFEPIFQVLIFNFNFTKEDDGYGHYRVDFYVHVSKSEKKVLMSAFWPSFEIAWRNLSNHDWIKEYKQLWLQAFAVSNELKGRLRT